MKKGLKLFGLFFAIALCLTLAGCDTKPGSNSGNGGIAVSEEPKALKLFGNMISNLEFTNEVAGTKYGQFSAVMAGNGKVSYKYDANNQGDSEISREVSVDAKLNGLTIASDNKTGNIYVITDTNEVYSIHTERAAEAVVKKMSISNVESFVAMYADLEGTGDYQNIVIMKTKDGKYYTDYKFSTDEKEVIRQIVAE